MAIEAEFARNCVAIGRLHHVEVDQSADDRGKLKSVNRPSVA